MVSFILGSRLEADRSSQASDKPRVGAGTPVPEREVSSCFKENRDKDSCVAKDSDCALWTGCGLSSVKGPVLVGKLEQPPNQACVSVSAFLNTPYLFSE